VKNQRARENKEKCSTLLGAREKKGGEKEERLLSEAMSGHLVNRAWVRGK